MLIAHVRLSALSAVRYCTIAHPTCCIAELRTIGARLNGRWPGGLVAKALTTHRTTVKL